MKTETHNILLVEDDADIRDVVKEALEMEGFTIETACSGEEAISKITHLDYRPELILLDLMMPNTDGVWFCKEKEKYPNLSTIPVIILSADSQAVSKTNGLGIRGILKKPIQIEDLFSTVRSNLI